MNKIFLYILISIAAIAGLASCSDAESYSNLLRDEEKATNWWLANHRVEVSLPEDSVFLTVQDLGDEAPFYKMDKDGYIYMQVVNKGDDRKAETGDIVYFRFLRTNLKYLYEGIETTAEGNGGADASLWGPTSFIYGNYELSSSSKFGTGIQLPLSFLGYNSEVNLVLRSYYGFTTDQSQCIPYLINIKYFKAEY